MANPVVYGFLTFLLFFSNFFWFEILNQTFSFDKLINFAYFSLQVMQIHGVHGVHATHFWTLCSNSYVGGLKLEVSHDADPKYVISHTQMIFRDIGVRELFVQLDYERQQNTYQNLIQFPNNNVTTSYNINNQHHNNHEHGHGHSHGGHGHSHEHGHSHTHQNQYHVADNNHYHHS